LATQGAGGAQEKGSWPGLLSAIGQQLVPVLLTAGSLIGFVAFAGGVIVWTRFSAAKVPPDQAVNAVPRDELVAIGSALLLLFGFFGVLALVSAFLVDRAGRATPGMARGFLLLFLVESVATIVIAEGFSVEHTAVALELLALPVLMALWATYVETFVSLEDDLPTHRGEREGRRRYGMFLLPGGEWRSWHLPHVPIVYALVGLAAAVPMLVCGASDTVYLAVLSPIVGAFLLSALWCMVSDGRPVRRHIWQERREREEEERLEFGRGGDDERREKVRLRNDRPLRLSLQLPGTLLLAPAIVLAAVLPSVLLGDWWVGVSIAAAALLAVALWRISAFSAERVVWFGVAVFLSVPLFGTLTAMARNVANPQVQPMALIRQADGPDEAIQGLYVTEADDRVYFATVATEGCSKDLTPHSGRLEWVPKSEVVAMSIGPLQDVDDAAGSALEMAYALTPAVETPAGSEASFTAGEQAEGAEAAAPASLVSGKRRLEDTGPAVRPNFGAGLSLDPEDASPEEEVTLRMSAPNANGAVEGFGRTRNGHTLRVGGVRAKVVKEDARSVEGSEYVETWRGQLLKLTKDGPYVRNPDGHFVRLAEADADHGRRRYLKLNDRAVAAVIDRTMPAHLRYLELAEGMPPRLADPRQTVEAIAAAKRLRSQAGRSIVRLKRRPVGQAWHEREIRFVVPENASTAAVSVECSQLAGQPLLRVAHAPEARISVQMRSGSSRVTFDSSRSTDGDKEPISRHWSIAGLRRGNVKSISADLPARLSPYEVSLTTTDESGRTDTVDLHLLRLPASLFGLDEHKPADESVLSVARVALIRAVQEKPPVAIEIDGHADDTGTARHNVRLSLRRAAYVRDELLREPLPGVQAGARVPVRTLAYGEGCPLDPRPGPRQRNRRVDVFILHQGVSMAPPSGCHPRRFESTELRLPPARPHCGPALGRRPLDQPENWMDNPLQALAELVERALGSAGLVRAPACPRG
jgi:outer membrane protein OmpA-like peptidoglycan-associated protein